MDVLPAPRRIVTSRFTRRAHLLYVSNSNSISYTKTCRAGGIRTHDLLNPIQAHYQAVQRPELKKRKMRRRPGIFKWELGHCESWSKPRPVAGFVPAPEQN